MGDGFEVELAAAAGDNGLYLNKDKRVVVVVVDPKAPVPRGLAAGVGGVGLGVR